MTTNAELIAEARRAYEYGVIDDFGGGASKDDVIAFVPQLADALVAAGTNCRALQDLYEEKRVALVAAEARLAKVREMAIIEEEFPSGYIGKRCLLCKGAWRYSAIEAHSDPVCPARPMEPGT